VHECEKFTGCLSCPQNGWCDNEGTLKCNPDFIEKLDTNGVATCVENEAIKELAFEVATNLEATLHKKRGDFECGHDDSFFITYPEFRDMISKVEQDTGFISTKTGQSKPSADEDKLVAADTQVMSLLKHFDALLNTDLAQGEANRKFDINWREIPYDSSDLAEPVQVHGYNSNNRFNLMFYAKDSQKTYMCSARHFLWGHKFTIVAIAAACLWLWSTVNAYFKKKEAQRLVRGLYDDIK
jgi:hypothetical protein